MSETDRHVHQCSCGVHWVCEKADCHIADECSECEAVAFARWAEMNGYHERQQVLEPVEALLGPKE